MEDRITQDNVPTTTEPVQTQPAPQPSVQATAPVNPPIQTAPVTPPVEDQPLTQTVAPQITSDNVQNPSAPAADPMPSFGPTPPETASQDNLSNYYKEEADQKAHKMKAILDAQPKVQIMLPLRNGEQEPSWEYVAINGYPIWIKKNVFLEVPQQVAEILRESYNLTSIVGKDHLIDSKSDRQTALR